MSFSGVTGATSNEAAEFVAKGVPIDLAPVDQTWGSREMYIKDAERNGLRLIQQ